MMINPKISIGTDIVEIVEFRRKPLKDNMRFYESIFSKSELEYCLRYSDPYPHIAGTFAAKEAVIKCFNKPLRMIDIEIVRHMNRKPTAISHRIKKAVSTDISISHTRSIAIAVVIIVL